MAECDSVSISVIFVRLLTIISDLFFSLPSTNLIMELGPKDKLWVGLHLYPCPFIPYLLCCSDVYRHRHRHTHTAHVDIVGAKPLLLYLICLYSIPLKVVIDPASSKAKLAFRNKTFRF